MDYLSGLVEKNPRRLGSEYSFEVKRFSAGLLGVYLIATPWRSQGQMECDVTKGAQARVPVPLKSETRDARDKPSQQWRKN
jgi:hypothetical protein